MSDQVMVLDKVNKGIRQPSSVQAHESTWLGRWTQLGSEVKFRDQNNARKSGEGGVEVSPFPMFKVSHKRDTNTKPSFHDEVGSSSKMPWMCAQGDNNRLDFPIQEKTTQNLLELIRPVRIYATGEIDLPEEYGHQIFKGSMKLKGKLFGGYLDLFPNQDRCHKGGVKLQSLESSEDEPRKNESSAETRTLEMDRLETIHLSGSISSSSPKGKGKRSGSAIPRTVIPDMNEEPPTVPDRDGYEGETSNSATQSMNVEQFMSRECKRVRLEPELEPSSRWVKRLKTTASDSDETKSLMKMEGGKGNNNNLFLEILKCGINNLQPRNQEPAKNLNQRGEDITLLHPWIQRWCKKEARGGQGVSFEPENQKEMEKKFPSIAAMALMGKALSGLNPYGLRKTDSLTVWNARDLR